MGTATSGLQEGGKYVRKTDSDKGKIAAMIAIAKLPDSDLRRKAYIYSALNIPDPSSDQEKAAAAIYADALDLCVKRYVDLHEKYENRVRASWTWAGGLGDY